MLLAPTAEQGEVGKATFFDRLRKFNQGEWLTLLREVADNNAKPTQRDLDEEAAAEKRRELAEAKVRLREVRRARVLLTSLGLAPGNAETLAELTDPSLRPTGLHLFVLFFS